MVCGGRISGRCALAPWQRWSTSSTSQGLCVEGCSWNQGFGLGYWHDAGMLFSKRGGVSDVSGMLPGPSMRG